MAPLGNLHNDRSKRKWITETALASGGGAAPSNATPLAPGTATAGGSLNYARGDHVHPAQTVAAPSDATPLAPGTAAAGSSLASTPATTIAIRYRT